MSNFDLRKFLAEGKLYEEATSTEEAMDKPSTKMKMSELKKKIREEILSELTLTEDDEISVGGAETQADVDFYGGLEEATKDGDGEVPSKDKNTDIDIEDKEEVEVDVEKKPKMSTTDSEFLDQLEDLKDEADAMGDSKLERQIDNTITYFTRQHIAANESIELEEADDMALVADLEAALTEGDSEFQRVDRGDKDVTAKDTAEEKVYGAGVKKGEEIEKKKLQKESLEVLKMKKLAGLITEGEYAKALLRENIEQDIATAAKPKIKNLMSEPRTEMIDGVLHIDFDDIGTLWTEVFEEVFKREMNDLIDQDVDDFEKVQNIVMGMITNNGEIEYEFDY